ncbi:MAG: PadR family transcriptional regulator [Candidatus Micrarchaeota archaeon]|nr:PadR family transcriptional regulator [Candidatus Micrarchaeota archaeon]
MKLSQCAHPHLVRKMHLFLLWMISRGKMHGYEILKALKEDGQIPASAGRLYPILNDMMRQGLISQREEKSGKRVRKLYVLTRKGRKQLEEGKKGFRGLLRQFVLEMVS